MLLTLLHFWLPVLSVLGLAAAVAPSLGPVQSAPLGALVLACGVLVVYSGERLVEPGRVPRPLRGPLWAVVGAAVVIALWCTWQTPRRLLPVALLLGMLSVGYELAKRHPLAKTCSLTCAWWLGCTVLPFELSLESWQTWRLLCAPGPLSMALSVAAGAILCDHKDTNADQMTGVRSVPAVLGTDLTIFLTSLLSFGAVWLAIQAGGTALCLCAFSMLTLSPLVRLVAQPLWGPLLVDAALAVPGLAMWWFGAY